MIIYLKRNYFEKQTRSLGELRNVNEVIFLFKALELPDLNNKRSISCIPEGRYPITKYLHPKKGKCLLVHHVPGRSEIMIHKGNYAASTNPVTKTKDTKGCILPGREFADIDQDGYLDIIDSTNTMNQLYDLIEGDHNYIVITS